MLNLHLLECTVKGYDHISDLLLAKYWVITGCKYYGCNGLTSVTIPNSVTSIGYRTFKGCVGLKSIYLMGTTPPSVGTDNFTDYHYKNITIYIPKGSLEAYQSAYVWKEFKNIQEI